MMKDSHIFEDFEIRNSKFAYKEFIEKYPQNSYAELARQRIAESEDDALERTYKIGTLQAFRGYEESYPNGKHIGEVADRRKWIEKAKIGIIVPDDEEDKFKSELGKFGYQLEFFDDEESDNVNDLSVVILITSHSRPNPNLKNLIAHNFIFGGGLIGAALILLTEPHSHENNYLFISSGNICGSTEYTRWFVGNNVDSILGANFLDHVVKADFLKWLATSKSDSFPRDIWSIAFKNNVTFSDHVFTLCAIDIMGDHQNAPIDIIIDFLKDKEGHVVLHAADALRKIKDPRAVRPLIDALREKQKLCAFNTEVCLFLSTAMDCFPSSNICSSLVTALSEITGQTFGNQPDAWAKWFEINQP